MKKKIIHQMTLFLPESVAERREKVEKSTEIIFRAPDVRCEM
jgi:hypothetical protein